LATKLKNTRHSETGGFPEGKRLHPIRSWIAFFLAVNMIILAVAMVAFVIISWLDNDFSVDIDLLKASLPTVDIFKSDEYRKAVTDYVRLLGNYVTDEYAPSDEDSVESGYFDESGKHYQVVNPYLSSLKAGLTELENELNSENVIVYAKNNGTGEEFHRNSSANELYKNGILYTDGEWYYITPSFAGQISLSATPLDKNNNVTGTIELEESSLYASLQKNTTEHTESFSRDLQSPLTEAIFKDNDITLYILTADNDSIDIGYSTRLSLAKRTLTIVSIAFYACTACAALMIFLIVYSIIRRTDRVYANSRIAEFLDLLWIEVKLGICVVILFIAPGFEWFFFDILFLMSLALILFWVLYLTGIDLRYNGFKRTVTHNIFISVKVRADKIIAAAVRDYNEKLRDAPFTKSMRKKFLTYAVFMAVDLFFFAITLMILVSGGDFLAFLFAGGFVALGIHITQRFMKSNDVTFREITAMSSKIHSIRNGAESEPLVFPADSLLSTTAASLNDIQSGIKTAVEEQMKSERMKIELVTNVSHDIKTPLTSLVSYTELLSKCDDMPDEANDYVTILKEKLKRLTELIGNLFDLSRAASNEMEIVREEIDLRKLVNQVDAQFTDSIEESTLKFVYRTPDEPVMLLTDGAKIHRVIENLYINVLKYSLEGSRVYVSLVPTSVGGAEFSITNISREEIDYTSEEIMARFVRGDKTRTTEGSGLGLAIARSFTELCGGQFSIDLNGDVFKVSVTL